MMTDETSTEFYSSNDTTTINWTEDNWLLNEFIYEEDDSNGTGIEAAAAAAGSFNMSGIMNASRSHYLNITADLDIRYALPLYGYIMPFLVVITIIANTLIVLVLSKKHMRTPTNLVLMAMALSDMLTLLFPAPWLLYLYTFGNHHRPLRPLAACYAYNYMNEVIPALFHTASIWLTLALAIQRYIYVCHPPLARTWCTMERSVFFFFSFSLILPSPSHTYIYCHVAVCVVGTWHSPDQGRDNDDIDELRLLTLVQLLACQLAMRYMTGLSNYSARGAITPTIRFRCSLRARLKM